MTIVVESVTNLVRVGPQQINMIVKFPHFDEPLPFTATPYDTEKHSRDLYAAAVKGEFGSIG